MKISANVLIISIVLLSIVGVFIYGGVNDWFNLSININNIENIENSNDAFTPDSLSDNTNRCTLSLSDYDICLGDSVTGTLEDGVNTHCYIFADTPLGWEAIYEGDTNFNGVWSDTHLIETTGSFDLRGLCDKDGDGAFDITQDCVTNQVNLNIEVCSSPAPDSPPDSSDTIYTCGQGGDVAMCMGSCPINYECTEIQFGIQGSIGCGCINGNEIHPDWKPDGEYYNVVELESDYYDMTGAVYWVHYDSFVGGSPLRMRGKFDSWSFISSSSGNGADLYETLKVTFGGQSVSIPINGNDDINLDDFMRQFQSQSGQIIFESKFSSGYVRSTSKYSGTVIY